MIATHRAGPAAVAALSAGLLLAGCGATVPAASTSAASPSALSTGPAVTAPAVPDPTQVAGPVELPWPAPTPADAAALQMGVDNGSQPWLLDPAEVALSYVAAAHDWIDAATAGAVSGSGTVTVLNTDGAQATLTLAQPVRTGPAGIWVVTAESTT